MVTFDQAVYEARRFRYTVNAYIEYEGAYAFYDKYLNSGYYGGIYAPVFVLKENGKRIPQVTYMGYGGSMKELSRGDINLGEKVNVVIQPSMGIFGLGFGL